MNKYRLDENPSEYYAAQFQPQRIKIVPHRAAGKYKFHPGIGYKPADQFCAPPDNVHYLPEILEHGEIEIRGPVKFTVYVPAKDGASTEESVELAKGVLGRISEMDAEARIKWANPSDDHEENLAYVNIASDEVELHYRSNTCNTEWGAFFKKQPDGSWRFENWG